MKMAKTTTATALTNFSYGMCNPVIRKMAKKSETMELAGGEEASYQGIAGKTIYFLLVCVIGFVAFFVSHQMLMSHADAFGGVIQMDGSDDLSGIFYFTSCAPEVIIFAVVGFIVLITPLLAWLIRPTIPVTGTLYAICEGYLLGVIMQNLTAEYKWIALLAFVLTALIVAGMLFVYTKRLIKVDQKFRTILSVVFFTMISGSLVLVLLNFIPALKPIIGSIFTFMNNPIISIISSIAFIIVAALFLLVDFQVIEECVEKRMPKKLEWMAAFGLVYTVIYIYFKILNLIIKIVGMTNSNRS